MDYNYWKNKYQSLWKDANKREEIVKKVIEEETGLCLEYYGLGAGDEAYLDGSASVNKSEKGEPDLHIINTNIFIEVTGSFSKITKAGDPLWFRPDKLNYAYTHRDTHDAFLVNNFFYADRWYVIHLSDDFWQDVKTNKKDYQKISPTIRGTKEQYVQINGDNPYIQDFTSLLQYLHEIKKAIDEFEKDAITRLRASSGMTQKEFAVRFCIPIATLRDWEQGRRKPPFYVIWMLDQLICN